MKRVSETIFERVLKRVLETVSETALEIVLETVLKIIFKRILETLGTVLARVLQTVVDRILCVTLVKTLSKTLFKTIYKTHSKTLSKIVSKTLFKTVCKTQFFCTSCGTQKFQIDPFPNFWRLVEAHRKSLYQILPNLHESLLLRILHYGNRNALVYLFTFQRLLKVIRSKNKSPWHRLTAHELP